MNAPAIKTIPGARIGAPPAPEPAEESPQYRTISIGELLGMTLPERPRLLSPFLPEQGLAMIYATRGIGKTYLSLAIGYAVASGGKLLHWSAPAARKVVYVDGEMPLRVLQQRLRDIVLGAEEKAPPENFQLLSADYFRDGLPNLSTREGQELIEPLFEGASLIILDNISTLAASGKDNDAESWTSMQEWLLRLRRRGFSVLLVHHAGKGGEQRGTSRREDVLDTSIKLRRPDNYSVSEGAKFEIHFEKARGIFGKDVEPFEVEMVVRGAQGISWTKREIAGGEAANVMALVAEGMSVRDIGEELGMSKSKVDRIKKAAAARMTGGAAQGQCCPTVPDPRDRDSGTATKPEDATWDKGGTDGP